MKRLITTLMILVATTMSANAANEAKMNVLNSIEIDSLKDTYTITLDTKSEVNMKRTIQSSNNMILTLKNIKPSKSLNTIYKNAAEVDSVMVEPVGDNTLNIIIQANNIANSAVTFNTEETTLEASNNKAVLGGSTKKANKKHSNKDKIVLSAPVDAYAPVYEEEFNEEDMESEGPMSAIIVMFKNFLGQGNVSNIVSTGLIAIILFCGIKLFKKEEPETAIGLAQSLKDRELSLYKDMSMRGGVVGPMSLERPQEALNIQRPQLQKQSIAPQVAKPSVNAKAGYGMRAYQASTKSPYMSSDFMNKRPVSSAQIVGAQQAQAPQPRTISTVGSRINQNKMGLGINRPVQNMSAPVAKASNIDSMKFLESMTQIYEKNGRSDLAQGLKAGMLKAKANV